MMAEKLYPNEVKPIYNGMINQEQRLQLYVNSGATSTMTQSTNEVAFSVINGINTWYYVVDDISKYNTLVAVGKSNANPYSPPNANCLKVAVFEGDTPSGSPILSEYFATSDTTRNIDVSSLNGKYCIGIYLLYSGGTVKQMYLE